MSPSLEHRFLSLLNACGATTEQAEAAWQTLSRLYQEDGKHYHTLTHIEHMLNLMDQEVPKKSQTPALELAIWYHDVIYDAKGKENEILSAKLCIETLSEITQLGQDELDLIEQLILSTQGHNIRLEGKHKKLNAYLLDLDLSILGAEWKKYKAYSENIRKEYIHMPLSDYQQGRIQVLTYFLKRKRLYFSRTFRDMFEARARENLAEEIGLLEG